MSGVLKHGDARSLKDTAPRLGPSIDTQRIGMSLTGEQKYEVHFRAPCDVVSITLGTLKGSRAYNSDRLQKMNLKPGTLAIHPEGSVSHVRGEVVCGEFVALEIPKNTRSRLIAEKELPDNLLGLEVCDGIKSPLSIQLAQRIRRAILSGDSKQSILAESIAIIAMSEIIDQISGRKTRSDTPPSLSRPILANMIEYIEEHLGDNMSLSDIANELGLSPYHLARCFKNEMTMSPHQYILERRVVRARDMLEAQSSSLADIAYAVGFSSQAHMTDVFRKRLGTTPGAYRKEFKS